MRESSGVGTPLSSKWGDTASTTPGLGMWRVASQQGNSTALGHTEQRYKCWTSLQGKPQREAQRAKKGWSSFVLPTKSLEPMVAAQKMLR